MYIDKNKCYIWFSIPSIEKFQQIEKLFKYIAEIKNPDVQICDMDIMILERADEFFTPEEFGYFWSPSKKEAEEFWNIYYSLPSDKREAHLKSVNWDFETVFEEIGQGEYLIEECIHEGNQGVLYFYPVAYPYGGNTVLQEALKAFGAEILEVGD